MSICEWNEVLSSHCRCLLSAFRQTVNENAVNAKRANGICVRIRLCGHHCTWPIFIRSIEWPAFVRSLENSRWNEKLAACKREWRGVFVDCVPFGECNVSVLKWKWEAGAKLRIEKSPWITLTTQKSINTRSVASGHRWMEDARSLWRPRSVKHCVCQRKYNVRLAFNRICISFLHFVFSKPNWKMGVIASQLYVWCSKRKWPSKHFFISGSSTYWRTVCLRNPHTLYN